MNFDAHLQRYLGKYLADYGGQCVSNTAHYCLDNGKPIAYANACDWWNHPSLTPAFDFITNNPSDLKQVPPRGAIMIWNSALAGSGGAGHIAIFDAVVSPGVFRSCDANWGGATVHMVTHGWNNIIGWMVPKGPAPSTAGDIMDNDDKVKRQYFTLRGNEGSPEERKDWVGKPYDQFNQVAAAEVRAREQAKADTQKHLTDVTNLNNQLNQQITAITSQANATKADKDAALVKIAELQTQLTAAMDKLKEAQTQPQVPVQPVDEKQIVQNVLVRFWNSLFKKG